MTETLLKIGEVARLVDVPAKTLRYYEDIGLISPAGRTDSGYRLYGWRELEQIEVVRRAMLVGLTKRGSGRRIVPCLDVTRS